jgi:carbonic anhydrase
VLDGEIAVPDERNVTDMLTTPPRTETVHRLLFGKPIEVAQADIERFARLYPMNARSVQPANRRFVLRVPG